MVFRGGCLFEHREEDVEHCESGERAVDVTLARPAFWIEGEMANAFETCKIPLLEGMRGAYNCVTRFVKVYEPPGDVERNAETLPAK